YRDGYKAHVAVEPETGIITASDLTAANVADGPVGVGLLTVEEQPVEVLGDSAYGSGPVRADLDRDHHTAVIKPWPLARNRRLGADQFTRDDFPDAEHDRVAVHVPGEGGRPPALAELWGELLPSLWADQSVEDGTRGGQGAANPPHPVLPGRRRVPGTGPPGAPGGVRHAELGVRVRVLGGVRAQPEGHRAPLPRLAARRLRPAEGAPEGLPRARDGPARHPGVEP
ncbi:MAG: transposase, partial [Actinobacteria bacterium]|nr:transposase [Actinomycetota bacterium]